MMQLLLLDKNSLENNMKCIAKVSKFLNRKNLQISNGVLILQDPLELKLSLEKRNVRNLWTDSHNSNNSQRKSRRCIT
jgi:hypothetical protein